MSLSILVYEHGGPEVMKWEDIPPQHPGRGEVLIDQKKVGLNFIDDYQRSGIYALDHSYLTIKNFNIDSTGSNSVTYGIYLDHNIYLINQINL